LITSVANLTVFFSEREIKGLISYLQKPEGRWYFIYNKNNNSLLISNKLLLTYLQWAIFGKPQLNQYLSEIYTNGH